MSLTSTGDSGQSVDWPNLMHELGPRFAERAPAHDANDTFVTENFVELRAHRALGAAVPGELGGGGASYRQLCDMLRVLAQYCASTALTLSMHTHTVATAAWRWRRDPTPVERLLRKVVSERALLVGSGASDWLTPCAKAERIPGGYRVSGTKIFASGAPDGDLLVTQAIHDDPQTGATVLHFALPIKCPGVKLENTWQALGMRGTGSYHVVLKDVVIPDTAISLRRPPGKWTAVFQLYACIIPLPLIFAVYVGIAEAARDAALAFARKRLDDPALPDLVGEMENELAVARMAHTEMIKVAENCDDPGTDTTNRVMIGRTIVGRAAVRAVEKAMAVVGGSSFYRTARLERLFRDVQGARFHRPQERMQLRTAGQLALGLGINE